MNEYIKGEDGRLFADERTKIAWETARAADEVAEYLLPEGQNLEAEPVYFDDEQETKGLTVVFTQGTAIGTDRKSLLIPRRTRIILDVLKIPYHLGFPD